MVGRGHDRSIDHAHASCSQTSPRRRCSLGHTTTTITTVISLAAAGFPSDLVRAEVTEDGGYPPNISMCRCNHGLHFQSVPIWIFVYTYVYTGTFEAGLQHQPKQPNLAFPLSRIPGPNSDPPAVTRRWTTGLHLSLIKLAAY